MLQTSKLCLYVGVSQVILFIHLFSPGSFLTPPKSHISAKSKLIEPFYNK